MPGANLPVLAALALLRGHDIRAGCRSSNMGNLGARMPTVPKIPVIRMVTVTMILPVFPGSNRGHTVHGPYRA